MACGVQRLRARHRARRKPAHGTGSASSPSSSSPPLPSFQPLLCSLPLHLLPCLHRAPPPLPLLLSLLIGSDCVSLHFVPHRRLPLSASPSPPSTPASIDLSTDLPLPLPPSPPPPLRLSPSIVPAIHRRSPSATAILLSAVLPSATAVPLFLRPDHHHQRCLRPLPSPRPPLPLPPSSNTTTSRCCQRRRRRPCSLFILPNFAVVLFSPTFSSSASARSRSRCLHPSSQAPTSSFAVVATSLPSLFLLRHRSHPSPTSSYPSPRAVAASTTPLSATIAFFFLHSHGKLSLILY